MGQQINMELTPPAGAADWHERDLPNERIRAPLRAANATFLDLVGGPSTLAATFGCAHRTVARHPGTVASREAVVAALPYALFDLRFRDEPFWRAAAGGAVAVQDGATAVTIERSATAFARVAVVFAWHVADLCVASASMVLGAPPGVVRQIAALPIGALDPIAHRLAPALAARFVQRDVFWDRVGRCLRDPAPDALAQLRLLGLQLAGTDSARRQQLQRRDRREDRIAAVDRPGARD
jgi:hypothetical protein